MKKAFVILGAVSCLALFAPACKDADGDASDGGSSSTSSSKASTSSGSTSTGAMTPTCADYCSKIMSACTGDNAQFNSMDNCIASCAAYPVGTAADMAGNTLGCRSYHAGAAATNAATHCAHAGPSGDGTCGDVCDGYCQLAQKFCTGANQVYTDLADCKATCATAMTDVRFSVSPEPAGPEVACLVYHAQEASLVPEDHCPGDLTKDAGGPSITCQ
jgi:hypothetical protein